MPRCTFTNSSTGLIEEGLNFGGSNQIAYVVDGTIVYAPLGGTSITKYGSTAFLNPLGLTSEDALGTWSILSHQDINTCAWRVTVKNSLTKEVKSGVYPFSFSGKVYQLPCGGEWVMASCGGYKIESTWDGQLTNECHILKGTGEKIRTTTEYSSFNNYGYRFNDGCGGTEVIQMKVPYSYYDGNLNGGTTVYNSDFGTWSVGANGLMYCSVATYGRAIKSSTAQQIIDSHTPIETFVYGNWLFVLKHFYGGSIQYSGGNYGYLTFSSQYWRITMG